MSRSLDFAAPDVQHAVRRWHDGLVSDRRGDATALRRAHTLDAVREHPEVYRLGRSLREHASAYAVPSGPSRQVAILTGLLVNLNRPMAEDAGSDADADEGAPPESEDSDRRDLARAFGEAMGRGGANGRGLHDLRFRRLLAVPDGDRDQLFRRLRPVLLFLARGSGTLASDAFFGVAHTAYYWGGPVRRRLAYGFYTTKTTDA